MPYETLKKIFYVNEKEHEKIYMQRVNSPFAIHLDFSVKEFNHNKSFETFYNYTEELALTIEKIYQQNRELLSIITQLPTLVIRQFGLYCIVEEVRSTSAIEGIHSTHKELKDIIEGKTKSKHFSSIIKKYDMLVFDETIDFETCQDIRNFYDDFALGDITADNPRNAPDGKIFRKDSVDVRNSSGKILHRGVEPENKIIENINYALQILNSENIPTIIRIAIFHYLFVYVHPFYDGNGRTARFISSYYLAKNFHYLPALRLSYIIKQRQRIYYDLIHDTEREINCGDLTPFIMGFCSIFHDTLINICKILNRKAEQIHKYEGKMLELFADDGLKLGICLRLMYSSSFLGQGVTMEELMKDFQKTRNTIKAKLKLLPENFLVIEKKAKKNFYKLNPLIFKNL